LALDVGKLAAATLMNRKLEFVSEGLGYLEVGFAADGRIGFVE